MDVEYLPRVVTGRIVDALQAFPIVIVDGPRGAGKTTTADRLSASAIRLPLDQPLIEFDPASTLRSLPPPVLIDEWQFGGTDLLWTLKQIVDDNPEPGQFILTGSVEPSTYGPTYPLTARAASVMMQPMTAAELNGRGGEAPFLAELTSAGRPPQAATVSTSPLDQMFTTGFPGARLQADPSMFLEGYASLVSQRAGDDGRDAARLLRSLRVLGVLTGQAVPDQRIWEAADINKATWKAYDDLLVRVHLAAPLAGFSSNALKRLTSYPKRFLTDTALALTLANLSPPDLTRDPTLAGRYFESATVQQLRPQVELLGGRMWHLRTGAGEREIDLIIDVDDQRWAIEVKSGQRPNHDDTRNLRWLHDQLGDGLTGSLVVHAGADTYSLDETTWAVPFAAL